MKLYEILLRKVGLWSSPSSTTTVTTTTTTTGKTAAQSEESKVYNPIGCKVGGVVKVDALDFREHRFTVREIQEYSVSIGGSNHRMVDYILLARPIGKPDFLCRLRIVPNPDSKSMTTHRSLLLSLYDDLAYNEGLHGVVRDETKKFVIDDDKKDDDATNDTHEEFWRVNDVGTSYVANVKTLADTNGDGKVASNEVTNGQVEFWDYSRLTDLDGVETEEFVFVEMNKSDGWFKIWRGAEVNPERIEVF